MEPPNRGAARARKAPSAMSNHERDQHASSDAALPTARTLSSCLPSCNVTRDIKPSRLAGAFYRMKISMGMAVVLLAAVTTASGALAASAMPGGPAWSGEGHIHLVQRNSSPPPVVRPPPPAPPPQWSRPPQPRPVQPTPLPGPSVRPNTVQPSQPSRPQGITNPGPGQGQRPGVATPGPGQRQPGPTQSAPVQRPQLVAPSQRPGGATALGSTFNRAAQAPSLSRPLAQSSTTQGRGTSGQVVQRSGTAGAQARTSPASQQFARVAAYRQGSAFRAPQRPAQPTTLAAQSQRTPTGSTVRRAGVAFAAAAAATTAPSALSAKPHQNNAACEVRFGLLDEGVDRVRLPERFPTGSFQVASASIGVLADVGNNPQIPSSHESQHLYTSSVGCGSRALVSQSGLVIGQIPHITKTRQLRTGEFTLVPNMVINLGSPHENWRRNASLLRRAMSTGNPIRDASAHLRDSDLAPTEQNPTRTVRQTFLGMERNLLRNRGWTLVGEYWMPPNR